jgi:FkbM family methyltransferase
MFNHLLKLKNLGYYPDIIFDIGAYKGLWTREMMKIFGCDYYLFEPIEYKELKEIETEFPVQKIEVFNELLYAKETIIDFYQKKNTGDSIYKENTKIFNDCKVIKKKTNTLNNIIKKNRILEDETNKVLWKLDTQGSELDILLGASEYIHLVDFIILEMPLFGEYNKKAPKFKDYINMMDLMGFIPYDILENHLYCNTFNIQIDMLFINKHHELNKLFPEILKL